MRAQVKADPFDTVEEEVAFLGVKRKAPFGKDVANTLEVQDEGVRIVAEEEDVIDDLAIAGLNKVDVDGSFVEVGKAFAEEGLPFLAHEEHEDSVTGWSIDGAKRHNIECVKDAGGAGKAKFVAVARADLNLMKAGFAVDADPEETASAGGKIVDGFVATGNREVVDERDCIEAAIGDAEAPNEIGNVGDVLLVGFGS